MWSNVTSVIPQGSVLGRILFTILYKNDLPISICSYVKIFADYTKTCNTTANTIYNMISTNFLNGIINCYSYCQM